MMRKLRVDYMLASCALALAVTAPGADSFAAPNTIESRVPLPPSANMPPPSRRDIRPAPARPATIRSQQLRIDRQTPPPAQTPRAEAPIPPAKAQTPSADVTTAPGGGFDIKGTIDKLFAASDAEIGEKLRAMVTARTLPKSIERASDRAAIEAAYAGRKFAPLWISQAKLTPHAKAVIARLKAAEADGLDSQDYPLPEFGTFSGADALAEADVKLTYAVLTYARHLQAGRIAPTRVTVEVDYGDHTPEPADILKRIGGARDIDAAFDSFNPPHAGFWALRKKLAELRAEAADPGGNIPDGPVLRAGMKDRRVPMLRQRLGIRGHANDLTYDARIAKSVQSVQYNAGLKPTGLLDAATLRAINGPTHAQKTRTVLANMERWRWLPRNLGPTYVMANIPDFTLKVVDKNNVVWRTKIVAGKPETPTPLTSGPMENVIVNPSWYVPQSIIQHELLPLYDSDPRIFERMGLEVRRGPDGHINVVQPPGAANALGHIKFAFRNKYQIYFHDTPEKRLFNYTRRAFSHGCMRVENPTKFGEIMLSLSVPGATPDSRQIYAMYGQAERTYPLHKRPMVHLTYQTAFVDDAGKLNLRNDLYGFDARIDKILTTDERRIADVAPPPDPKRDLEALRSTQEILRRVERREALNPFVFFERLFR